MDWSKRYNPPQKNLWKGRTDGVNAERYHEIVKLVDLRQGIPSAEHKLTFGLIGFASDEGITRNKGRTGAYEGPKALRQALAKMPSPDPSKFTLLDLGDITCDDALLEEAQACLGIIIAMLLAQNVRPIVIGGGHEVAWGNYQGISIFNPTNNYSIVNFDAHYDLRPVVDGQSTSGTSFSQIYESTLQHKIPFNYTCIGIQPQSNTRALHERAQTLNVKTYFADNIPAKLSFSTPIYLTICLDVFAAPFAPGVSAPQPLGVLPLQLIPLLKQLAPHAISFDIAELSPPNDTNNITASLAASLIAIFLDSNVQSL